MNIAFRFDTSPEIGIGHLMRCLALSEEFLRRKHKCYFVSKIDNENLINRIKKNNVFLHKMEPGSTLEDDRNGLIEFSNENHINWIITDHYELNAEYVKELKQKNFKVLSIDDTAQIYYYSDIVLNQNISSEKLNFTSEKYTKFLLGTKYAMIRDQILNRSKKTDKEKVEKILIMLGGTDRDNLILKILKMLEEINEKIEFVVLIGPLNPHEDEIKKYIKDKNMKVKVIKSPKNMAEIYLDTDIAISAGGSSCYELAYFGIPNIIITIADNQLNIAKGLDNKKTSIFLGKKQEINKEKLQNRVKELINNDSLRNTLSKNGKKLVDGKGKERIVKFMERYN